MRFEEVRERLRRLPDPLPRGRPEMEPSVTLRTPWPMPGLAGLEGVEGAPREAAALVLLYPDVEGEACVVLTARPDGDHAHAGEVALPGGKREPGDEFPDGTALREAAEEVGLDARAAGVRVLGRLDVIDVRVTGYMMVPVLALAEREPALLADTREVAAILAAPVRQFLPDAPIELVEEERPGLRLCYAAYRVSGYRVWGATGKALAQLGAILGRSGRP